MHPAARAIAAGYLVLCCGLTAALWPANRPATQSSEWNGREDTLVDASSFDCSQRLSPDVILPDLKPWRLTCIGVRRVVSEGKPAFQFTYTTDVKQLGPVTLFVTRTAELDIEPSFDKRENFNLLYWRHRGHGYYIISSADKGWLWSLKNDIAYQLKAL